MTRAVRILAACLLLGGYAVAGVPHPTPAAWTPTGGYPGRVSVALALQLLLTWRLAPLVGEALAERIRRRRPRPPVAQPDRGAPVKPAHSAGSNPAGGTT